MDEQQNALPGKDPWGEKQSSALFPFSLLCWSQTHLLSLRQLESGVLGVRGVVIRLAQNKVRRPVPSCLSPFSELPAPASAPHQQLPSVCWAPQRTGTSLHNALSSPQTTTSRCPSCPAHLSKAPPTPSQSPRGSSRLNPVECDQFLATWNQHHPEEPVTMLCRWLSVPVPVPKKAG